MSVISRLFSWRICIY